MSIGQEKISYENEKELFANVFAGASFAVSKHLDISAFAGASFAVSKHLDISASFMSQAYEGGFINVNGSLGFRLRF